MWLLPLLFFSLHNFHRSIYTLSGIYRVKVSASFKRVAVLVIMGNNYICSNLPFCILVHIYIFFSYNYYLILIPNMAMKLKPSFLSILKIRINRFSRCARWSSSVLNFNLRSNKRNFLDVPVKTYKSLL